MKQTKTNAMRILDRAKISYQLKEFPLKGNEAAVDNVSAYLGLPEGQLFKTLVTTDTAGGYFVFCIPTQKELDLKKAARAAGVKRIEMLKQKDLFQLTGYVHGGCSPVGMKKLFPTFLDESMQDRETIVVSAGKPGMLMEVSSPALQGAVKARTADLTK